MAQFNLDEYEPVEERIKKFYKDHEDGRILTDLMSPSDKPDTAIFKAFLYIGDILKATGWALEKNGDGFVNKTSHLENCETSAIGRALANAGYQGSKRPSREEMQKVARMNKQPDEKKAVLDAIAQEIKTGGFSENEISFYRKSCIGKELFELRAVYEDVRKDKAAKKSAPKIDAKTEKELEDIF